MRFVRNFSISFAALSSGCLLFASLSSPCHAIDLLGAYRDALTHDAQYAAARAARDAGLEQLPQGRAGLLPSVSLNASIASNRQESQLRYPGAQMLSSHYSSTSWAVQLTQPVFRWQNWVTYTQAELAVAAAELQWVYAGQDLILRVAQSYFDVLSAQETLLTAQSQKQAIGEQLEAVKKGFKYGAAMITDVHEAQSRFDLVLAQEISARSDLALRKRVLRALTGRNADEVKSLRPGVLLTPPRPENIETWIASAETGNLKVQLGQNALEIATREIEKQRAGHLPTLDFVASHGKSYQGKYLTLGAVHPGFDTSTNMTALQFQMPLFSGGGVTSKEREVAALREKTLAELESARRGAALEAEEAYLGVFSGLAEVKAYEAAVHSSQSSLDSNRVAFRVGLRINIDVLNAQRQLYDTRRQLTRARLDTLIALLKLKAAAGSLSEDDVIAVNALLE